MDLEGIITPEVSGGYLLGGRVRSTAIRCVDGELVVDVAKQQILENTLEGILSGCRCPRGTSPEPS